MCKQVRARPKSDPPFASFLTRLAVKRRSGPGTRLPRRAVHGGLGLLLGLLMLMPAVLPSRSVVAARAQEPPPAAPESQDAALLAELAQRWRVGPTGAVRAANVRQLLPGQLPDAMPLTVPIPAGSRLVGSVLRGAGGQTTS